MPREERSMHVGMRIDEAGVLLSEEDVFYLRRERGGRLKVDLRRAGAALVGQQVRLRGTCIGEDFVDADQIDPN